jgi:CO/xanthine dehydrogenase Mo-binding subunit
MTKTIDGAERSNVTIDTGRRNLLKAGGGLVIGFTWLSGSKALAFAKPTPQLGDAAMARADGNPAFAPNAFIRIGTDGSIRLVMPEVEMGQGAYTGQATLIAEELAVDLDQVKLEHAPPSDDLYGLELQGFQNTGGSNTIRACWDLLRQAGAVARTMLVAAAAKRWGVPAEQCRVERGVIHHDLSRRTLSFGQVASDAARQPVPAKPELLSKTSYRLIGKSLRRTDTPAKSDGSAIFGIDIRVPGMKVAAVVMTPTVGGKILHVDDHQARAIKGVVDVVVLDDAVAVTAGDYWTASKAAAALRIRWDKGANATLSTPTVFAELADASRHGTARVGKEVGAGTKAGSKTVEASYQSPMLAHATMEPQNAVVSVQKDRCEIWIGTQVPTRVVAVAAAATGLAPEKISVYNQYIGGGFGRRLETDSVEQAVAIAKRVSYPVKVIWSREQDFARDFFRPPYHDHFVATLDAKGSPVTWHHRVTSDTVLGRWSPADMPKDGLDPDTIDGAAEPPYAIPALKVEWVQHDLPKAVKIGWWRGVGATHNLFPVESFMDELAHAAGVDPVAYRRSLLAQNPRARAVLDLGAAKFGWDKAPAKVDGLRIGRGVALGTSMTTLICAIVEVGVTAQGDIRIRRAAIVADCGQVVNPNTIEAQLQGGLVFGLSAALWGEATIHNGAIEQSNFHDYRVLRMPETPTIDAYTVPSAESPTGIGEPPTAIAGPALANAVFAATGVRVRNLPIARTSLATGSSALGQVVI